MDAPFIGKRLPPKVFILPLSRQQDEYLLFPKNKKIKK
jgi:hypothetical protein